MTHLLVIGFSVLFASLTDSNETFGLGNFSSTSVTFLQLGHGGEDGF